MPGASKLFIYDRDLRSFSVIVEKRAPRAYLYLPCDVVLVLTLTVYMNNFLKPRTLCPMLLSFVSDIFILCWTFFFFLNIKTLDCHIFGKIRDILTFGPLGIPNNVSDILSDVLGQNVGHKE